MGDITERAHFFQPVDSHSDGLLIDNYLLL